MYMADSWKCMRLFCEYKQVNLNADMVTHCCKEPVEVEVELRALRKGAQRYGLPKTV